MNIKKVSTTLDEVSPIILATLDENIDVKLTVTGSSMYPLLINKRDSVILTKCDEVSLKKGDIPLYKRNNGKYVLHRIVRVNENSYDLCGDNQYIIERNLPKKNIIAVVKAFERNGKFYSCDNILYNLYWRIRIFTIPFRRLLQRSRGRIRRIK
ncbi:S24/S26 family peptidase [Acetivibrio cellulolyticus]|uniref:S24/S26 family peptidase n=1 Tax=Acetivibrio cellulolyticus TaxID=35830 RepID=UPI0001E2D4F8|nr:S24/S26 family peptidase [Acetivibrio cellulolyticus]